MFNRGHKKGLIDDDDYDDRYIISIDFYVYKFQRIYEIILGESPFST